MVMYYQKAREKKPDASLREAKRGGWVVETDFLNSPQGQELNARHKYDLGNLGEKMRVGIEVRYGETWYTCYNGVYTETTGKDRIIINFGDVPIQAVAGKRRHVDFVQQNLSDLKEKLPEPVYHIFHEVRPAIDIDRYRSNPLFTSEDITRNEELIRLNPLLGLGFPYITIDVLTGAFTRRKYREYYPSSYSKKEIRDIQPGKDVQLEIKRVSGLPFGINALYEVTVVEPVKEMISVNSNPDGTFMKVNADALDNPNVAKALDAVVGILFKKSTTPASRL